MWESFWFEFINFYFIPGLVLGCIYALGAIGITLTFGILRFANFAHGEIMMTSSYLTWEFVLVASSFGLILHPIIGAIPASICAIILALIGLFNIVGTLGMGYLGTKYKKKILLSLLYASRAVIISIFIFSLSNSSPLSLASCSPFVVRPTSVHPVNLFSKFHLLSPCRSKISFIIKPLYNVSI